MAKRFTDTSKWAKESFSGLSLKMKLVWIYLCDNCDHAGVWDINLGLMSYQIGQKVTLEEIREAFADKVSVYERYLQIPSFVNFQYGHLNPENRVHKSVLTRLDKLGPLKPLTSPLQGAKDKDKEKDKEKDEDKEKEKDTEIEFESAYRDYPRKESKAEGMERLRKTVKTQDEVILLKRAVKNYAESCRIQKLETRYIRHWSSFIGPLDKPYWRDWIDWAPSYANTGVQTAQTRKYDNLDALERKWMERGDNESNSKDAN